MISDYTNKVFLHSAPVPLHKFHMLEAADLFFNFIIVTGKRLPEQKKDWNLAEGNFKTYTSMCDVNGIKWRLQLNC